MKNLILVLIAALAASASAHSAVEVRPGAGTLRPMPPRVASSYGGPLCCAKEGG